MYKNITLSEKARYVCSEIDTEGTKLGDLRKIAKEIKKDHRLAVELWSTGTFFPRLLSILIFDVKKFDSGIIDNLIRDIEMHDLNERLQLIDWLMANQLTKDKKLIALLHTWQNNSSPLKRRVFWYYQGRLRWTGQIPPDNTKELLTAIEEKMPDEDPEVQWAMNFAAAWIGIFDRDHRNQCIQIGEKTGLYKDEIVAKNCTPNYLPKFIEVEVKKRKL